jgi:hypothetical protein
MCQMTHDRLDIPFLLLVPIVYATEKKNTKSQDSNKFKSKEKVVLTELIRWSTQCSSVWNHGFSKQTSPTLPRTKGI